MSSPPLFKNIGKAIKDLLTKKIDDEKDRGQLFQGQVLKFKTVSDDGVTIESYTRNKGGDFTSEVATKFKCKGAGEFTLTLKSNTDVELSLKNKSLYDGLTSTVTASHNKKGNKVVADLQYVTSTVAAMAKITQEIGGEAKTKAELSAALGEDGLSVGVMLPVEVGKPLGISSWDSLPPVGVQWELKDLTCSIITRPEKELELAYVQKVSGATTIGSKFHLQKESAKVPNLLSFAMSHKCDSATSFNGTFDSTGALKGTVSKKFADPKLTASFTFGMNLTKGTALTQPIGVAIALGDA